MRSPPVVLFIFNRPDLTRQTLEAISRARPSRLLVVADGPRRQVPEDAELCRQAKAAIEAGINWPVSVRWNISDVNLGNRKRLQTGLDWVFEHEDAAIILEDDCVPDPSFFRYCRELLRRYREDARIATIAGSTAVAEEGQGASYVFSRYPLIGGWATWSRAWRSYDRDLAGWPGLRDTDWLQRTLDDPLACAHWAVVFDETLRGANTWDFQLTFSCWRAGMLSIHPVVNLVANVGVGPDATHMKEDPPYDLPPRASMRFPLVHPPEVQRSPSHDLALERLLYSGKMEALMGRVREKIQRDRGRGG